MGECSAGGDPSMGAGELNYHILGDLSRQRSGPNNCLDGDAPTADISLEVWYDCTSFRLRTFSKNGCLDADYSKTYAITPTSTKAFAEEACAEAVEGQGGGTDRDV